MVYESNISLNVINMKEFCVFFLGLLKSVDRSTMYICFIFNVLSRLIQNVLRSRLFHANKTTKDCTHSKINV